MSLLFFNPTLVKQSFFICMCLSSLESGVFNVERRYLCTLEKIRA